MKETITKNTPDIDALKGTLNQAQKQWIDEHCALIDGSTDSEHAVNLYFLHSGLCRRQQTLDQPQERLSWHVDQIMRLLLLLELFETTSKWRRHISDTALIESLFKQSDSEEKIVILKALHFLPHGKELVNFATHASRSNNTKILAAIALNNPYPAGHYGEREFNQLILKALFADLDIRQTIGLSERLSPTLSRLCQDLVEERLLAQRQPPQAIEAAMCLAHLSEEFQLIYRQFKDTEQQ